MSVLLPAPLCPRIAHSAFFSIDIENSLSAVSSANALLSMWQRTDWSRALFALSLPTVSSSSIILARLSASTPGNQ
jgi:hypothetical protein